MRTIIYDDKYQGKSIRDDAEKLGIVINRVLKRIERDMERANDK